MWCAWALSIDWSLSSYKTKCSERVRTGSDCDSGSQYNEMQTAQHFIAILASSTHLHFENETMPHTLSARNRHDIGERSKTLAARKLAIGRVHVTAHHPRILNVGRRQQPLGLALNKVTEEHGRRAGAPQQWRPRRAPSAVHWAPIAAEPTRIASRTCGSVANIACIARDTAHELVRVLSSSSATRWALLEHVRAARWQHNGWPAVRRIVRHNTILFELHLEMTIPLRRVHVHLAPHVWIVRQRVNARRRAHVQKRGLLNRDSVGYR